MNGNIDERNRLRGRISMPDVIHGKSAYEIAVTRGFVGTEEEWLDSLAKDATERANIARYKAEQARFGAELARDEAIGQTNEKIHEWLDGHPEATTTVQDRSITAKKLAIGALDYITPEMFGAVGDGVADDSEAIEYMFQLGLVRGFKNFKFLNTYRIVSAPRYIAHTFEYEEDITIESHKNSKVIIDNATPDQDALEKFLWFKNCKNCKIELNIVGNYDKFEDLGYCGCTAIHLTACESFDISISAKYCRYVVKMNGYHPAASEICENISVRGTCGHCGYFVSANGVRFLDVKCDTDKVHRSVYVAGAENVNIDCAYTKCYIADCNVLLTTDNLGDKYSGVKNAFVKVVQKNCDMTTDTTNLIKACRAAGIATQEYDLENPCAHENINVEMYLYGVGEGFLVSTPADALIDVTAKNVIVTAYDYRDKDGNVGNRVARFMGGNVYKLPITLILPYGAINEIVAYFGGTVDNPTCSANLTIRTPFTINVMGGDIQLDGNSVVSVNRPNSLTLTGHNNFPSLTYYVDTPCVVNGEECTLCATYKGYKALTDDNLLGKSSALLWCKNPTKASIYSVTGTTETLIFSGVVNSSGREAYFAPLQTNKVKLVVDDANEVLSFVI